MSENEKTDEQILDDFDESQGEAETSADPEEATVSEAMADARPEKSAPEDAEVATDPVEEPEARPYHALPAWKCHKTVEAFKIVDQVAMSNGRAELQGADCQVIVESDYLDKHRPQLGGYYVKYHDGSASWSPAGAFEAGYDLI